MAKPDAPDSAANGPPATQPASRAPSSHAHRWERACRSLILFLLAFLCYLFLAAGSGEVLGQWSWPEMLAAAIVGLLCAAGAVRVIGHPFSPAWLDPIRWCGALLYLAGPFFYALVKANLEVLWLILTGRIHPAVVRIEPGIQSPFGLCLLANSITLSPGTLTMVVDDSRQVIYVHCLNWKAVPDRETATRAVAGTILPWVRWLSRPRRIP